ncbi:Arc family DNA-binding protein [Pseudomonas syringae]|uniref:Arc family DNA-binding protein n=1 Tax=Pseudomonas syringae TaxID=317 RepID=UPI001F8F35D1|nr:Arc family DNA-binding protein [Pseudomonas syringae]
MKGHHQNKPYSLRIAQELKARALEQAHANRRSLNSEIGLLIEEGLKWREIQNK